jgi:hypothetical protein
MDPATYKELLENNVQPKYKIAAKKDIDKVTSGR